MLFCVFKHRTAYEWRSGDWSSDVCCTDLGDSDSLGGRGRRIVCQRRRACSRKSASQKLSSCHVAHLTCPPFSRWPCVIAGNHRRGPLPPLCRDRKCVV